MWSPAARNVALTVACATLATVVAVQAANRLIQWRVQHLWRQVAAERRSLKSEVPRATLSEFQAAAPIPQPWVALCGTVFDVSGDPFFDHNCAGIYSSWLRCDVAALLVYGGVIDGRPANESEDALLVGEIELPDVDPANGDVAVRRRNILEEWYARFHSRYEVVGEISDVYAGSDWDALREQLTPPPPVDDDGKPSRRGKCPLGFGSSAVEYEEIAVRDEDAASMREIRFQGRRYDVRGSALFESPHGALAHFVGHDITYALATQSNDPADGDITPSREYTYEEQLRLEHFRRLFAKELRLVSNFKDSAREDVPSQATVDLHVLIDQDVDTEEIRRLLGTTRSPSDEVLNSVCSRSSMAPLHKAVEKNRLDLVELLISAGADIDAPAALYDDETALQMAQRFRYEDIISSLTAHPQQ